MFHTGIFQIPYFISPVKDHLQIKEELLKIINEDQGERRTDLVQTIYKTDFHLKKEKRQYFNILSPYINDILKDIHVDVNFVNDQGYIWYQQYIKLNHHSFHSHDNRWSGIYYLELDKKSPITEFKDYLSNKHIAVDVQEGDVLIFPGWLEHRSPPNLGQKRKTVIAFNLR